MLENNKVIWSEGIFLLPQHFQQQDRYVQNLVNRRCLGLQPYDWGFYSLTIDSELFKVGKLALKECKGIFPDGTPFNLPEDDELPLPLDIPQDIHNEIVFLTLPVRRPEMVETDNDAHPDGLARFRVGEREVRDNTNGAESKAALQVGKLKIRLMCQREERSGYTGLGVARVKEARADKSIIVDDEFIPPNLNCFAVSELHGFLGELHGLLNSRGEEIASQLADPDRGGVAEITKLLMLQLVNRYQQLFAHFSNVVGLHPEGFYRIGIQLAGELATFFRSDKRPVQLPPYQHDDLQATFSPLIKELRELLSRVIDPRAIRLPLKGPKYNIYGALRPDLSLLESATFVLAAKADVPAETLRRDLPRQVKIGPSGEIHELIRKLIPGISIDPLTMVPRQIPYHAGFTYFVLNKDNEFWSRMKTSGGFAIHIGANLPGLELEFWAILEG
jgi:type VI secretion system protein ImpJ